MPAFPSSGTRRLKRRASTTTAAPGTQGEVGDFHDERPAQPLNPLHHHDQPVVRQFAATSGTEFGPTGDSHACFWPATVNTDQVRSSNITVVCAGSKAIWLGPMMFKRTSCGSKAGFCYKRRKLFASAIFFNAAATSVIPRNSRRVLWRTDNNEVMPSSAEGPSPTLRQRGLMIVSLECMVMTVHAALSEHGCNVIFLARRDQIDAHPRLLFVPPGQFVPESRERHSPDHRDANAPGQLSGRAFRHAAAGSVVVGWS